NLLRDAGLLDEAVEAFRTAVGEQPRLASGWYNLGDLLFELGRADAAITALGQAVDADPDHADAHYNLALCLESVGRWAEARVHWRRYLTLDETSPWADVARRHLSRP
ncbi:MAG: tetratricopeptide repeat protein, partial [Alphaproteobacteria bacterium]|nr:tetratricopeptide repeat protein [Alphaproteobacteria bacterium]